MDAAERAENTPLDTGEDADSTIAIQGEPLPIDDPDLVDAPPLDTAEAQNLALEDVGPDTQINHDQMGVPVRPPMSRDTSVPAPKQPPPPAPPQPAQELGNPTDSLSLMQLKRLVNEFPKVEPEPYAFVYVDTSTFEEELDELFGYSPEERASLLRTQTAFARRWQVFNKIPSGETTSYEDGRIDWTATETKTQQRFLEQLRRQLEQKDGNKTDALECLLYLSLGCWHETAGVDGRRKGDNPLYTTDSPHSGAYGGSQLQISTMYNNIHLIARTIDVSTLFNAMKAACLRETSNHETKPTGGTSEDPDYADREEPWVATTLFYMMVDVALRDEQKSNDLFLRDAIVKLHPDVLVFLTDFLAEQRWDDSNGLPPYKILLLYWKSIILTFGGSSKVNEIKSTLTTAEPVSADGERQPKITASPLDYHIFRQELTSKYPAFEPPPSLFPFEPDNNSILPPLRDHPTKPELSKIDFGAGPANINGTGASIFHQPVHIATPVPSPPPSPAGPGGKGIKKQNYQTNQMFPFLYPPIDEIDDFSTKSDTEMQQLIAGKKWRSADIPASILEAAELFSRRMRATRAMKQLWEERVKFMKYEREFSLLESLNDEPEKNPQDSPAPTLEDEKNLLTHDQKQRLDAVEDFYKLALPRLQSTIVVLLKVLLQTVTTLVTQPNAPNGLQNGFQGPDQNEQQRADSNGNISNDKDKAGDQILRDLDIIRSQEIMGKAVSAIFLLLLKWFKVSHILKFEYLTQLLLDSNFIQLILKLFTHQELERIVNYKCERKSLNFLRFCQEHSRHGTFHTSEDEDDEKSTDAIPPPIQRQRQNTAESPEEQANSTQQGKPHPEVDELGCPTSEIPSSPITDFSWRNFFSSINHLRVLQKIVKHKAHRQLLMVQYKYSNILKKWLKVPQSDVRLYTLKIIKGQVPYCHRKWRQSNMRIITAIYLHCRPELRDEWLAGVDVENEMGDALASEQALRALTYWHNLRRYPDAMGQDKAKEQAMLAEDQDFFVRELEKIEALMEERGFGDGPGPEEEMIDQNGQRWEPAQNIESW